MRTDVQCPSVCALSYNFIRVYVSLDPGTVRQQFDKVGNSTEIAAGSVDLSYLLVLG